MLLFSLAKPGLLMTIRSKATTGPDGLLSPHTLVSNNIAGPVPGETVGELRSYCLGVPVQLQSHPAGKPIQHEGRFANRPSC